MYERDEGVKMGRLATAGSHHPLRLEETKGNQLDSLSP